MSSTLVSIGQFDLKLNHLLIIGILALSFSISFLIRAQPAEFGWELHEFDPFFNYRATEYLVNNGIDAYFEWDDELSWHPIGRDVSSNSQVILHFVAAGSYLIFGGGTLYDFTIIFPVVFGSLTCIVIFALVRVIGGTTAGLFSALLFSVSLPVILRGQIGWFKSEPLGLFFSIFAVYLFLSGINSQSKKTSLIKLVFAGIFTTLSLSSWGGNQFFIIPLGIFFIALPFIRSDHKFLIWAIPIFTISTIVTSLAFERPGPNFVFGLGGLSLMIPTIFLTLCIFVQRSSNENHKIRNGLFLLIAILIIGSIVLIINVDSNFLPLPSHRYLNAINPLLTTTDPLTDSVSEHATTTIEQSFLFHTILMLFSGIGIWLLFRNSKHSTLKKDMIVFSLIIGLIGVYVSSTFVRLEVFASISIIILSSLGLTILIKELFSNKTQYPKTKSVLIKSSFLAGLIILLILPLTFPTNSTVFAITDNPPTILNGGTSFSIATNDWNDSLEWIKNNTDKDAVIASWWDYGYWIQTKADRPTLADNSTVHTNIIQKIAEIFLQQPDEGWNNLQELEADYFVLFVSAQRLNLDGSAGQPLYALGGGGDESKKQWFMRIANEPLGKFLHADQFSGTETFWNETLLGKLTPFSPIAYVNVQTQQQSSTFVPGYMGIYEKDIKFSKDGNYPLRLVYSSPSFETEKGGSVIGVFVYEINKDYVPLN